MATLLLGKRRKELEAYALEIGAKEHIYQRATGWELDGSDAKFREALKGKFPEAVVERGCAEYPGEVHLN